MKSLIPLFLALITPISAMASTLQMNCQLMDHMSPVQGGNQIIVTVDTVTDRFDMTEQMDASPSTPFGQPQSFYSRRFISYGPKLSDGFKIIGSTTPAMREAYADQLGSGTRTLMKLSRVTFEVLKNSKTELGYEYIGTLTYKVAGIGIASDKYACGEWEAVK